MARVKAFAVRGLELWFYSGDHHPPHFHARRAGDWEARVYFAEAEGCMIEIVRPPGATVKGGDRRALIAGARAHRFQLLTEWEECQAD